MPKWHTYVAWCWDAGSSTVTNTEGSITSQVRANASAGFSVVTYTATDTVNSVGHGLELPLSFVIKSRSNNATGIVTTDSWCTPSHYPYLTNQQR
jgi:hypothetical protein